MFHISMGTLRHYEQTGLLTPEYTDPDTGYRYYGTRQFELLNTIRNLRVLDFPLGRIKAFLDNRDTEIIEEQLVHQKELELISRKIDHRLDQLRDAMNSELDVIRQVRMPENRVVWLRICDGNPDTCTLNLTVRSSRILYLFHFCGILGKD